MHPVAAAWFARRTSTWSDWPVPLLREAKAAGSARVPAHGTRPGKGDVLWKALAATTGDIIVYVDADLLDFRPTFITGLLGPLLTDPDAGLVKAFYDRPLLDSSVHGGGRSPNSPPGRC